MDELIVENQRLNAKIESLKSEIERLKTTVAINENENKNECFGFELDSNSDQSMSESDLKKMFKTIISTFDSIQFRNPHIYGKLAESTKRFLLESKESSSKINLNSVSIQKIRKQMKSMKFLDDLLWVDPSAYSTAITELIEAYECEKTNENALNENNVFVNSDQPDGCLTVLSDDALLNVFSFLSKYDLLNLRLVSWRLKKLSDIQLQKQKILCLHDSPSYLQINFLLSFYRNIDSLNLRSFEVPFQAILCILKSKRINLKHFGYDDAYGKTKVDANEIVKCFPKLESLSLECVKTDECFFQSLSALNHLTNLELIDLRIICEETLFIPSSVRSLVVRGNNYMRYWHFKSLFEDESVVNLRKLVFEENPIHSTEFAWPFICDKLVNLVDLSFSGKGKVISVFPSKLKCLRKLSIDVKDFKFTDQLSNLNTVKALDLNISLADDDHLAKILNCFPRIEILKLCLNSNMDCKKSVEVVSRMNSLRKMAYVSRARKLGATDNIISFVEASETCCEFCICVFKMDVQYLRCLLDKFNETASKRNYNCKMTLISAKSDDALAEATLQLPKNIKFKINENIFNFGCLNYECGTNSDESENSIMSDSYSDSTSNTDDSD